MFVSFVVAAIELTLVSMEGASRIASSSIRSRNGGDSTDGKDRAKTDGAIVPASETGLHDFYARTSEAAALACLRAAIFANDVRLTEIASQSAKLRQ